MLSAQAKKKKEERKKKKEKRKKKKEKRKIIIQHTIRQRENNLKAQIVSSEKNRIAVSIYMYRST